MTAFLLLILTLAAAWGGRWALGRWLNPLTAYSAVWGTTLVLNRLRLLQFDPIAPSAWLLIAGAAAVFWLGGLSAGVVTRLGSDPGRHARLLNTRTLERVILGLSAVAAVAVAVEVREVIATFGSFTVGILAQANLLYQARLQGELTSIPYIGALTYAACALAGVHVATTGKLTWVAILPLVLTVVHGLASMSRAGTYFAGIIFATAFLQWIRDRRVLARAVKRLVVVVGLLLVTAGLVSANRGLTVDLPGQDPAMDRVARYLPLFPSFYATLAAPPVALGKYLESDRREHLGRFGQYTFAPVFRALNRVGLVEGVRYYEAGYYTPTYINTSTYLKNAHQDFGVAGSLVFVFVLAFVAVWLMNRAETRGSLASTMVLAHLYAVILLSFSYNIMVLGYWLISLMVSGVAGWWIEGRVDGGHRTATATAGR